MHIGQKIKELRLLKGYTQEELGVKLGLKKAAVQKYENGTVENLKRSTIAKLAQILEVSPAYLMGWDDDGSYDDTPLDFTKNFTIDGNGNFNYEAHDPIFPADWPREMIDKVNEYIEFLKPKYNITPVYKKNIMKPQNGQKKSKLLGN